MNIVMITTNLNKTQEQIDNLSRKINLKYGLYCVRGETFSGLYRTGSFKNLIAEIYRLAKLSESVEQQVIIQAC